MSILDEIFCTKYEEVAERQRTRPLTTVRSEAETALPPHDFIAALRAAPKKPALIAEVKCASPSRGLLVKDFDPLRLARIYMENGASAISVLTDERYFKGHLDYLSQIAQLPARPPLLRKDFICDPYQVYEARAAGADAVLLIAAHLAPGLLSDLHALICQLGMAPLVEVHSQAELELVLKVEPKLIGINNRDLRDFTVHLENALALKPLIPAGICIVAESGIHTPADAMRVGAAGIDAILVGEALVTALDTALDTAAQVRLLSQKDNVGSL